MTNVALLSIDALRFDRTTLADYDRETTPGFTKLMSESVMFAAAYSGSSHTREAIPSLLTGQYPDDAVADDFSLAAPSLATLLTESHSTGAFHSNPYVSQAYEYDKDFNHFYDSLKLGQNRVLALIQRALDKFVLNRGEYHTRAEEINRRSLSWLDSLDDGTLFFLWNHYMDVHGPYNPPEQYNDFFEGSLSNVESQRLYNKCVNKPEELTDTEQELLSDLYDGEIRYVDSAIDSFLNALDTRGLLDDTLVIVTADHGELFGEHGAYAHPRQMYPELLHVPLLVRPPGGTDPEQVLQPVSTLDIVPTILDTMGRPVEELPGVSLLSPETHDREVVFGTAAGEDENAHLRRYSGIARTMKHDVVRDITDGTRRNERTKQRHAASPVVNTTDGDGPKAEKVKGLTRSFSERITRDSREANKRDVASNEVEDRLEDLGYL